MVNICQKICNDLQSFFDIPFDVTYKMEYQDPVFVISPQNELDELFEVRVLLRQKIRLIVEIEPQKYSASMIDSFNQANNEKRKLFLGYVEQIKAKGAKIEFFINKQLKDILLDDTWVENWNSIRIRATKIVDDKMSDDQEQLLIMDWAKLAVGLTLSLLDVESITELGHAEGRVYQVTQNRYERNPVNRELCLSANGYKCKICGFDFLDFYGELGRGFIHVHHIEMVSSFGGEYYLDPVKDLIPVCPNCHAMLHKETPPMLPEKLKGIIMSQSATKEKCHE